MCDFSIKHFKEILKIGLKHYRFIPFIKTKGKTCILRHDIDYFPERAIVFGEIEKKLSIRATYFFQVCAKTYNLREKEVYEVVNKLNKMGHYIGLHLDMGWGDTAFQQKDLFYYVTGINPVFISIHTPDIGKTNISYPHTYEKYWFKDIKYLSDSRGWCEGCMCKIFAQKRYEKIQLLLHPYLWPDKDRGFVNNMDNLIEYRKEELKGYMKKWHPVYRKLKLS